MVKALNGNVNMPGWRLNIDHKCVGNNAIRFEMDFYSAPLLAFLTYLRRNDLIWVSNLEGTRYFMALYESHHHTYTGEVEMKFNFVQNVYLRSPIPPLILPGPVPIPSYNAGHLTPVLELTPTEMSSSLVIDDYSFLEDLV